ncbi:MAG TPA: RluA family pseudouridine synthase [Humidesulfovibrio sp.]|uniref:pseudouridine synthase family protein n=1 Tax=Humidesulfovibrio sp. TaxID=2910988 RepID=UPI002B843D01|nr:RluA family pseudouridine synthase [Humidesulfovibrio sp.]HWR04626.1 RluA family pseudouridine synthase [Humidesulfovibrio sp.]
MTAPDNTNPHGTAAAPEAASTPAPARAPLVVTPEEAGQKLLQFLQRRLGRAVPGSAILRIIRTGEVRVDGGRKKPFFRLAEGQEVRVPPLTGVQSAGKPAAPAAPAQGQGQGQAQGESPPALDILLETPGYVAVRKPAGLCSHAGTRHKDSVADRLKALYAGAPFSPVLTHRLDKDTSGILLAAKSYAELRRLNELFATGGVAKTYLAWVDGSWPGKGVELMEDRLDRLELAEGAVQGRKKVLAAEGDAGKSARAEVRPLLRKRQATLLAVRLLTGRTHQIRVQLSLRGHPVISDSVYGRKVRGLPMLLHALCLRLPERALFAPPPWGGPFALPQALLKTLEEELAPAPTGQAQP